MKFLKNKHHIRYLNIIDKEEDRIDSSDILLKEKNKDIEFNIIKNFINKDYKEKHGIIYFQYKNTVIEYMPLQSNFINFTFYKNANVEDIDQFHIEKEKLIKEVKYPNPITNHEEFIKKNPNYKLFLQPLTINKKSSLKPIMIKL